MVHEPGRRDVMGRPGEGMSFRRCVRLFGHEEHWVKPVDDRELLAVHEMVLHRQHQLEKRLKIERMLKRIRRLFDEHNVSVARIY